MARRLLTEDADLRCDHNGRVMIDPSQSLVTIEGRRVLVKANPRARPILRCRIPPPPVSKPCYLTVSVDQGYSSFVWIEDAPVCLDTVSGFTDGLAPGTSRFSVEDPGQPFVAEEPTR